VPAIPNPSPNQGHEACLRWLLLAEDGPRLTDQIVMRDLEGRAVPEQVRSNSAPTLILLVLASMSQPHP